MTEQTKRIENGMIGFFILGFLPGFVSILLMQSPVWAGMGLHMLTFLGGSIITLQVEALK